MWNILLNETFAKLPVAELEHELAEFLVLISDLSPEKRLRTVLHQMVRCILTAETPVVAAMSCSVLV